jgi:hypothetical protein
MSDPIFIAIVGFLAAIGGGVLQVWANRNFEEIKFGRQARNEAYLAYEKGIGLYSFAKTDEAKDTANALIAEARGRIALFGSPEVITAMAKVFRRKGDLHAEETWRDHSAMLLAMRADIDRRTKAADQRDIFELVYGESPRDGFS